MHQIRVDIDRNTSLALSNTTGLKVLDAHGMFGIPQICFDAAGLDPCFRLTDADFIDQNLCKFIHSQLFFTMLHAGIICHIAGAGDNIQTRRLCNSLHIGTEIFLKHIAVVRRYIDNRTASPVFEILQLFQ